jgi:hypothetical protein
VGTAQPIPRAAAQAIENLLDDCAAVERDQHVVILAAVDGLYGGTNVVDQTTISWLQEGVQARGAYATVMWIDLPVRRNVIWPDIPTRQSTWRIPPPVRSVMRGADLLISNVLDFSTEEELKEWPELLAETKVRFVRNMATTAGLLSTAWARMPHKFVSELRLRTAELIRPNARWELTNPNGTCLEGIVGPPAENSKAYTAERGRRACFPEGIYPAINPLSMQGELVFDRMMPTWARKIGVPQSFEHPVTVTITENHIVKFEGGAEARIIQAFYAELAKVLGEDRGYEMRAPHGGVHPAARIRPSLCPDEEYREFLHSFHPSSIHLHFGNHRYNDDFPYCLHAAPELRGSTLKVDGQALHNGDQLGVMNHPSVVAMAAKYQDRPALDAYRWI